ncbi:MAG TPA: hypothetical protein VIX35_02445 [Vicinamibacterales bacterium]
MHPRVVLALACAGLALAPGVSRFAADTPAAALDAPTYVLALRFTPGERIVEHADIVDRMTWILPAAQLESFRSHGVVIEEQSRTHLLGTGVVTAVDARGAAVASDVAITTYDVPRQQVSATHQHGVTVITPANTQAGTALYPVEDAPMIGLPGTPVALGDRWTTRQRVVTRLGSGIATFEHVVGAVNGTRVRVDVSGAGTITGKEYNLPRLLPGTIRLTGSAWFDQAAGLIVQESYHVENELVKPDGSEQIGFIEALDADSDVHKEEPAAPRN